MKRQCLASVSILSALAAGVIALVSTAVADTKDKDVKPDAGRGQALAEKLCVSCHVVSREEDKPVTAGVPTFRAIANKPGQTADNIRAKIIQPHAPMPDIQLSRQEITDIIAYLDALRSESAGPPLLPEHNKGTLPDYPEEA